MKILISILSEEREHWYKELEAGIRETWGSKKNKFNEIIDIVYFYARPDLPENFITENDKLWVKHEENYFSTSGKNVMMLEHVLQNYDFDYLFRTNLSSYINLEKLIEYAKDKPKDNFYCGITGQPTGCPHKFVSGSGHFLSRNLVSLIVSNKHEIEYNTIDDLELGRFLDSKGIQPVEGLRWQGEPEESISILTDNTNLIDLSHYHFRLWSENKDDYLKKMHLIHGLLNE